MRINCYKLRRFGLWLYRVALPTLVAYVAVRFALFVVASGTPAGARVGAEWVGMAAAGAGAAFMAWAWYRDGYRRGRDRGLDDGYDGGYGDGVNDGVSMACGGDRLVARERRVKIKKALEEALRPK